MKKNLFSMLFLIELPIIAMNEKIEHNKHQELQKKDSHAISLKEFKSKFNDKWNDLFCQTMNVLFLDLNSDINNNHTQENLALFLSGNTTSLISTRNHLEEIFAKKLKKNGKNILSYNDQCMKKIAYDLATEINDSDDGWTPYLITQTQLELNQSCWQIGHAPFCLLYCIKSCITNCFYNRSICE